MRKPTFIVAALTLAVVASGCAITDFSGWAGHNTQAEAKLWGTDIAFITGDSDEGTYTYTVKYDNRAGQGVVTINTYKNPVAGAFTRDGIVDQDGDAVQGSGGSLTGVPATPAGKFLPVFKAVDSTGGGSCEFFANITFDKSANGAGIALCATTNEEIDKDFDLSAAFASLDDLLGQIWAGAVNGSFTMELTSIELGGIVVPVETFPITAHANGIRPSRFVVDLTQPAAGSLIQAILDNTADGQPVSVGLHFAGGLNVQLPGSFQLAFNHSALLALL